MEEGNESLFVSTLTCLSIYIIYCCMFLFVDYGIEFVYLTGIDCKIPHVKITLYICCVCDIFSHKK